MLRATQLEPRTQHQPEKPKKLSKNDLVVLLLFLESIKSAPLYLIHFQSNAGRPQPGDRILCSATKQGRPESTQDTGFRDWRTGHGDMPQAFVARDEL
jgi:hypothetical protein